MLAYPLAAIIALQTLATVPLAGPQYVKRCDPCTIVLHDGYPPADFELNAADISVGHPAVVETYRKARSISLRDQRGEADTEELRQAVVHYRTLFNELLTVNEPTKATIPPSQLLAHT